MKREKGTSKPKARTLGVRGQFDWSDELFAGHTIRDPLLILAVCVLVWLLLSAGVFQAAFPAAMADPNLANKYGGIVAWLNTLVLLFVLMTLVVQVINVVRLVVGRMRHQTQVCPIARRGKRRILCRLAIG